MLGIVLKVTSAAVREAPRLADALAHLTAMARLASETGAVIHVVSPRAPGLAERARILAIQVGLDVSIDFQPTTIRVRFSP